MIKQLILLFNLISVVGFNFFFQQSVTIDVMAPEKVEPGSEFTIELTVNKGQLDGFAKLQQELPEGFLASKVEGSNSTFSFKDQQIKYIWMALPSSDKFTISYKVKVDPSANGVYQIDGSFSYIENNEKQLVNIPNITIMIGDVQEPVTASNDDDDDETPKEPTTPTIGNAQPQNGVFCARTISPVKGKQKEFKVEIKIQSDKRGFAKIEEFIPEGFTATEIQSRDGLFSLKNQTVKIIWMSLPAENEFIIAYKLMAGDDITGNQRVNGTFSYIEGNLTQKFALTPSNIFIEQDEEGIATIIIDDEGGTIEEKEQPTETVTQRIIEPMEIPKPEDDDEPKEETESITSIPKPESDIVYKVQVAAGHKSVESNYFDKKYKLKDKVSIENHEGWIKYTIGSFPVYKESRDHRNQVWNENKIKDAFVTAYNYSNRITVQEALMITNQKWYN